MQVLIVDAICGYEDKTQDFTYGQNQFIRNLFEDGVITDYPIDMVDFGYLTTQKDLKPKELRELADSLDVSNYEYIVTLGAKATEAFGIKDKLGESITKEYPYKNCKVLPCYSPSSLAYNPGYAQNIAERIYSALQLASGQEIEVKKAASTPYEVIDSYQSLLSLFELVKSSRLFVFDFETTGLEWWKDDTTVVAISVQPGYSYIVPLLHFEASVWGDWPQEFSVGDLSDQVSSIFQLLEDYVFSDESIVKVAQNLVFELGFCAKYGCTKFWGEWHDTMLMYHELNENTEKGLKFLATIFFPEFAGFELTLPKEYTWATMPFKPLADYNAVDSDVTCRLFFKFTDDLLNDDQDGRLYRHYRSYVMPALFATFWTSFNGSYTDQFAVKENIEKAEQIIKRLETEFYNNEYVVGFVAERRNKAIQEALSDERTKIATELKKEKPRQFLLTRWNENIQAILSGAKQIDGWEFSLNSWAQVQEWLFDYLGLPLKENFDGTVEKTSTQDYVLELAKQFDLEVLKTYCALKIIMKIHSTYLTNFRDLADSRGFIHTNFKVAGTQSGRLSSSNPNLQNVVTHNPIKDSEDLTWAIKSTKGCFVSPPGDWVFLQADFSQAELRMIANFSRDENMTQAYLHGIDLHTITGARIMGKSFEDFVKLKAEDPEKFKEFRQKGKTANFGWVYDISLMGYQEYYRQATKGTILSKQEAQLHKDAIFDSYPSLPDWHAEYVAKANEFKYVRTLYGRKRHLTGIDSMISSERGDAKRAAINSPIQGTAGEWTVQGMSTLTKIVPFHLGRFSNTIHDSVLPYIKKDWLSTLLPIYDAIMTDPMAEIYIDMDKDRIVVPMKVDWSYANPSWADMVESSVEEIIQKFSN